MYGSTLSLRAARVEAEVEADTEALRVKVRGEVVGSRASPVCRVERPRREVLDEAPDAALSFLESLLMALALILGLSLEPSS